MLVLLSPAKKQQFGRPLFTETSKPPFQNEANQISQTVAQFPLNKIESLMKINKLLAYEAITSFQTFSVQDAKSSALSVYNGPAFSSLNPFSFSVEELKRANKQLIILSGLYGVLHPSNDIVPYRLEMTLPIQIDTHKNLYSFWKDLITDYLLSYCVNQNVGAVINCASSEYSKSVDFKKFSIPVITCDFREMKNGVAVSVSSFAKQARGLMARWIIQNNPSSIEMLQLFSENNYTYSKELSTDSHYCFIRSSSL